MWISLYNIWVFLKIVVPQIIHFYRVFHYKPSILGYPVFLKTPILILCQQQCESKGHQTKQRSKSANRPVKAPNRWPKIIRSMQRVVGGYRTINSVSLKSTFHTDLEVTHLKSYLPLYSAAFFHFYWSYAAASYLYAVQVSDILSPWGSAFLTSSQFSFTSFFSTLTLPFHIFVTVFYQSPVRKKWKKWRSQSASPARSSLATSLPLPAGSLGEPVCRAPSRFRSIPTNIILQNLGNKNEEMLTKEIDNLHSLSAIHKP